MRTAATPQNGAAFPPTPPISLEEIRRARATWHATSPGIPRPGFGVMGPNPATACDEVER